MYLLQAEQMANLRAKWEEKKRAAEKEHGTSVHLELPDILITHELSYEAPAGKANADRAVPMPRPLVRNVAFRQPRLFQCSHNFYIGARCSYAL